MTYKEIFESGFIRAFVYEYYEYQDIVHYTHKDRLLFAMCNSEVEKRAVTLEQIKKTKSKIKSLGNEELSVCYFNSCNSQNSHEYIKPDERFDYFCNLFANYFNRSLETLSPITEKYLSFEKWHRNDIDSSEMEDAFWNFLPQSEHPKYVDLSIVIPLETDLIVQIQLIIEDYNKDKMWEIDFEELEKYKKISKPLKELFKLSQLFVQVTRLEMFNYFKSLKYEVESKNSKILEQEKTSFNKKMKPPKEEDLKKIKEIIIPLSAYWQRTKIMDKLDFQRFTDYVIYIFENNSLPDSVMQFPNTGASNQFISKTIHNIYVYLGKLDREVWVSLVHLFKQFDNTEPETTNRKFSNYSGYYEQDLKNVVTY